MAHERLKEQRPLVDTTDRVDLGTEMIYPQHKLFACAKTMDVEVALCASCACRNGRQVFLFCYAGLALLVLAYSMVTYLFSMPPYDCGLSSQGVWRHRQRKQP